MAWVHVGTPSTLLLYSTLLLLPLLILARLTVEGNDEYYNYSTLLFYHSEAYYKSLKHTTNDRKQRPPSPKTLDVEFLRCRKEFQCRDDKGSDCIRNIKDNASAQLSR